MRKTCLILLALSACNSEPQAGGGGDAAAANDAALAGDLLPSPEAQAAQAQALAARTVPVALGGAADARFRNVRAGSGGTACGEVVSKAFGKAEYRPFVVSQDGVALFSDTPGIAFNNPADPFVDAWIRWCATPEELQALTPKLREPLAPEAPDPLLDPSANAAVALAPPLVLPPPVPARPAPAPPPRKAAPPPQIDSFFNSVQRNGS